MESAENRLFSSVSGLIRMFAFCLMIIAMVSQVAHLSEYEAPDEVTLTGAVSEAFGADNTDGAPVGKSTDICAVGFSCHAPALLVTEEIGLPLVFAAAPAIFTKAKMYPGQSVDVPLQPPLIRRV
jgi:hypothetical protein